MALYIDERELVVEILSSLKRFFKFKELESILGISIPTLWRYIHGDIKPSRERSRQIIMKLLDSNMIEIIKGKVVKTDEEGLINVYTLAYNLDILTIASIDAMLWAQNMGFTAVSTVETDGIPLATLIAKRLDVKMVTIKRKKEVGFNKFIEVNYITRTPPEVVSLYLPEGVVEYGDRVLVVDDLVRSGRTSIALFELIKRAGARPTGFYALISIGDSWRSVVEKYVGTNYRVLFRASSTA